MARVAVLHNTLDLRGGADGVCLHVCEALQDGHDVTLFTLSRARLPELNDLFGTGADVDVRTPRGTRVLNLALDAVASRAGPLLPLRSVLLDRYLRHTTDGFDLAVSTANEFAPPLPSVQYVHYPQFNLARIGEGGRLNPLWSRLAGLDRLPEDATMCANSAWTADVVERIYGRRPGVLHPPVEPIDDPLPWAEREDGFVVLGRIAPDKRVLDAIRIVEGVRARGHDVHLHVVGSASPNYRSYVRRVRRAAAGRDWVRLERGASRDRVESLLRTRRYGLNVKPDEHFGTAVAEYVAAGMVAFVPDSGGQVEIVDGRADRTFASVADAVETIDAALRRDARPRLPRDRFDRERFHEAVRELVGERLEETSEDGVSEDAGAPSGAVR